MISLIQLKKGSNKVVSVLDKFVIKYYISSTNLERDLQGIRIWSQYDPNMVPKLYLRIGKLVVFEFIKFDYGSQELVSQLLGVYRYFFGKPTYEDEVSEWNSYLLQLQEYFASCSQLNSCLTKQEKAIIIGILEWLTSRDWNLHKLFPLHRDICWTNALKDSYGRIKLIDFEHHLHGPIEYEFANSLFWQDSLSVNVDSLIEEADSRGVYINRLLANRLVIAYVLDQLRIADRLKDSDKLALLTSKLRSFVWGNQYLGINKEYVH